MTLEQDVAQLKRDMVRALATTSALQGQPADATLSIPHNDSWLFEDNVDSTHAGNLRYVISGNVQRVVSARLSIHLAPYRTYNNVSGANTGAGTAHHHPFTPTVTPSNVALTHTLRNDGGSVWSLDDGASRIILTQAFDAGTTSDEAAHVHPSNLTAILGVTEGSTAAGVTVAFDGVDATANLGGPFSADAIELNVLPYLPQTKGVFHAIAMLPSGLGRIEAHLRLGVYVAAGSTF